MTYKEYSLAVIAEHIGAELADAGAAPKLISGIKTLELANESDLAFVAEEKYLEGIEHTAAGGVIMRPEHAAKCPVPVLLSNNPYLSYARATELFAPKFSSDARVHPSASVDQSAVIGTDVVIGPNCVVEANVRLGEGTRLVSGVTVGRDSVIGENSLIYPGVVIYHQTSIGDRAIIHGGAVIGADGFGFAPSESGWQKIHQLGNVRIGSDVEIGANSTIDRGAISDTVIGDGVKIDDLVMIAHNVEVGDDSALAGQVGIAGSTRIGKRCILAGNVGLVGHIELCDDVIVTGKTMITKSISKPGSYSSGTPFLESRDWRKSAVRFGQLDAMSRRLASVEKKENKE